MRREFLDEVRCLVFEVRPRGGDDDGFKGRIWVEDRHFTIVRFNGISREADNRLSRLFRRKISFHIDSWRVNVQPAVWLHLLIDTKFAFADRLMIPDAEVVRTLRLYHSPEEEAAADAKLVELLNKSPYQNQLTGAGLFLRAIGANAKALPNLIQPHMGDYVMGQEQSLTELIQKSPELAPERLDQIAALPLGARLVMDPWSSRLDLIRTPAVPLMWAREKLELAITPMAPYLRYAELAVGAGSR